jgi:hypothetical protein
MGQESDQLIYQSLDDGGLAPIDQEDVMQHQYRSSTESDENPMNPDVEATREEIERTRERMSETIGAISERLDPHALTQQAKGAVRGATIGRLESAAKAASTAAKDAVTSAGESLSGVAKGAVTSAGESLSGAAHKVKDTIGSVGDHVGSGAQANGGSHADPVEITFDVDGSDRISWAGRLRIGPRIESMADQARSGFRQGLEKKPLLVGIALVGLGALVGFLIPESEQESRLLGRMGSRWVPGARVVTDDQADRLTV